MTADQALDELREEIHRAIREARFWGVCSPAGLTAMNRAIVLFRCYRALRTSV